MITRITYKLIRKEEYEEEKQSYRKPKLAVELIRRVIGRNPETQQGNDTKTPKKRVKWVSTGMKPSNWVA